MPIQPISFQPLSFEQNNPFLTGMKSGEQLYGGVLQNKQMSLANQLAQATLPYAAPSAQAQLQAQQLANALQQNTLKFAPQMSQADLAIKQAQPGLINAQTGETRARIPLLGAQTNLTNEQAQYLPLETLIKAQNANQASNRYGQAYQLAKTLSEMPAPTRATWIANNQESYNQMVADIANGKNQNQSFITPEIMQKYFPGMQMQQQPTQQQASQTQQMPVNASGVIPPYMLPAVSTNQPVQQQQPAQPQQRFANPTPEMNALTKQASMMAANKDLTTAATRRQLEGAIQVENVVNDPAIQQQVVNAAQYAGAVGKGSKAIAALSQTNPQAYESYISLKNQTMPLLLNRIKTLDQMGGTDKQREELEGLYSKTMDSLTSNSDQFVGQFNQLTKTLDTIAKSAQKSATPIFAVNRLSGSNQINNPYQPPNAPSQAQQIGSALNTPDLSNVSDDVLKKIAGGK